MVWENIPWKTLLLRDVKNKIDTSYRWKGTRNFPLSSAKLCISDFLCSWSHFHDENYLGKYLSDLYTSFVTYIGCSITIRIVPINWHSYLWRHKQTQKKNCDVKAEQDKKEKEYFFDDVTISSEENSVWAETMNAFKRLMHKQNINININFNWPEWERDNI